jgi:hypothetical protein
LQAREGSRWAITGGIWWEKDHDIEKLIENDRRKRKRKRKWKSLLTLMWFVTKINFRIPS